MKANGYSDGAIKTLWEILVPFSDYAFNKAHTAGYGLVSYWTAFLKANYPAEYMAALLTSVKDDKDKSAVYLNECRKMGIKVLPPDVNDSDFDFTPRGTDIRFGLSAIRNVGGNVVDSDHRDAAPGRPLLATSTTSSPRSTPPCATSASSSRSSSRVPSTPSATPARASCRSTSRSSTPPSTSSGRSRTGSSTCSAGSRRPATTRWCRAARSRSASGTRPCCSPTSGRCSGCTCPTTRCTARSGCSPSSPTGPSRPC